MDPRPTSPWLLSQGVWGDNTRRHSSIEAQGQCVTKTSDDYQPSTAISRVPAFINFFAEVKIIKCMRGTAIGLVVPTVELDQQWSVSRMMKKEREVRQRELDKTLQTQLDGSTRNAQESSRAKLKSAEDASGGENVARKATPERKTETESAAAAIGDRLPGAGGRHVSAMAKSSRDFEAKEREMALKQQVRLVRQNLFAADHSIKTIESKIHDRWGPRLWYLTCDGLFGVGAECKETGAKFSDGDVVRLELENQRLIFSINGTEVPETACEIQARTFLAACLHMKGACLEIVSSSLMELEHLQSQGTLEDEVERAGSPSDVQVGCNVDPGDSRTQQNVSTDLAISAPSPLLAAAKADSMTISTTSSDSPASPTAGDGKGRAGVGVDTGGGQIQTSNEYSLLSPMPAGPPSPMHRSLSFQASPLSGLTDHDAFQRAFTKIFDAIDGKWGVVERSFQTIDLENTGTVDRHELGKFFEQFRLTAQEIGMHPDEIFSYIDDEEEGKIKYLDFLEEVSVAGELKRESGPVRWERVHEDMVVNHDDQSVTAMGSRGRSALLSRIVSKGKHRFEFFIKKMTGTIFIGLMQANRKVYIERGQKVVEIKTRPLDDNWYYSRDTGGFSVWYISDIGVIRKDSTTIEQAGLEISSGDTVLLELNLDRSEVTFYVRGRRAGCIRGVEGELYPAVFISGDEGDCVCLTRAEMVKARSGAHSLARAINRIIPLVAVAPPQERWLGEEAGQ
jgi:hypothetical protein